ncbi:MAG: hypothetical protein RKH07_14775 [Gammaproteobacteria bacterium]
MKNLTAYFTILFSTAALLLAPASHAQDDQTYPELTGSFEGSLVQGRDEMNLAFTFSKQDGEYAAALVSGGMGIYGMPADEITVTGRRIRIRIPRLDVEFTGTMRFDDSGEEIVRIDGDWFQYSELVPVVLLPVAQPSF